VYKRILFYVDPEQTRIDRVEGLLDLVTQLDSRLIVLSVLPENNENASEKKKKERDELEDRNWKFLYQIEDVAFEREIKVSLMLEEGELHETIASVVKSYEVDICATFPYKGINVEDLLSRLNSTPLLLINQER